MQLSNLGAFVNGYDPSRRMVPKELPSLALFTFLTEEGKETFQSIEL